jgi:tetratricopeptide (TPR) repeat protein
MSRRSRIAVLVAAALAAAVHASLGAQADPRARQLYDRAIDLDRRGNAAAALSLLWDAAGLAPQDGEIQHALGSALERIGALDGAIEAYRGAVRSPRPPRGASNSLVLALVKAGLSVDAIAYARGLTAASPDDANRWFTLGLAEAEVDVDGAVESFRRALSLDDRHALARYNLGLVFFRTDRFQPAIEELNRALAIQPRPEVHYTLGSIYRHLGDLDRAVTALTQAVAANPEYADAHLALGTVLKARGDVKRAVASLKRAAQLRPDLAAPQIVLAQTLALSGDDQGARRASAEAERLRTESQRSQEAAALTAVGAQKLDAGDAAGAADAFRRATQAFDGFAPAHYQLGRALDRLGRHEEAKAAFARAQQLNPALIPPR